MELKVEQDKVVTGYSNYFSCKSHFQDDIIQNYLGFQPVLKCFKKLLIAVIFQQGNKKDCLKRVFNLLLTASNNSHALSLKLYRVGQKKFS